MRLSFALPLLLAAAPATAQLRPLVAPPSTASDAARDGVDVFLINEGREAAPVAAPETIETIARDGTVLTLELVRSTADTAPVPAGGFARLRYRLAPIPADAPPVRTARADTPRPEGTGETVTADGRGVASGFTERFRAYEPTYLVAGAGDAAVKAQFSFAMRPFGGDGLLSYLNIAYTQTIFLASNRPSGPITSVTYSPEVFYDVPVGDEVNVALGYRHSSNGGGPSNSVDANRIYLRVNKSWDLGGRWRLDVAPMGWIFFGTRGIARDIDRFWGNGGINASIFQENGVKFAVSARGNPGSGRGAAELFASYPLHRLGGDLGIYLFGQAYTGYGETLEGYNRAETRARIGFALSR